jgi:glycosyltransferase involved in cell wall biosynthesis
MERRGYLPVVFPVAHGSDEDSGPFCAPIDAKTVDGTPIASCGVTRVAIDVGPLVGARTGIGQFVAHLLDGLQALPDPPELHRYALSLRAALPEGVHRLPYPAAPTLRAWGRIDWPRPRRSLGGAEVVHGTNYVVPPTAAPAIVTVHDCSFVTRPDFVNDTVRAFVPVVQRAVGRGALVHTPSAYVAGEVTTLFGAAPERVRVIPHGPPLRRSPDAPLPAASDVAGGRPYILALATREPRKNLPRLVEAYGLLSAEHPDVALVLVGPDGPDQANVDAAIARLPRAGGVVVRPWMDDAARAAVLAGASVLAVPSYDEGFGLPLLEAMQFDVPVVASRAGALPEVAADAALYADPHDAASLAGALLCALTDDATRARLVAAGRRRVADYSWERTATAFAALYREAAMEGRA